MCADLAIYAQIYLDVCRYNDMCADLDKNARFI